MSSGTPFRFTRAVVPGPGAGAPFRYSGASPVAAPPPASSSSSPPFLAMRVDNGTVGVYRFASGAWTIVGNTFGGAAAASDGRVYADRVRQLNDGLFVFDNGGVVRKYDPVTGNWDAQFSSSLDSSIQTGILRINSSVGGVELLISGDSAGNPPRTYTSSDGITWTIRTPPPVVETALGIGRAYVFRGSRVFWPVQEAGTVDIVEYDRNSDSWVQYTLPVRSTPQWHQAAFVTVNNRLLCIGYAQQDGVQRQAHVFELIGSAWVDVQAIGAASAGFGSLYPVVNGAAGVNALGGKCSFAAFEEGGSVYVVWMGSSDDDGTIGTHATKLVPSGGTFIETAVMTVVPADWRSPSLIGGTPQGGAEYHSWTVMKDVTPAASTANVYLFGIRNRTDPAKANELLKWNGDSAEMTLEGSVANGIAPPMIVEGSGDQIWDSLEFGIEVTDTLPVDGGEEIQFKAFSPDLHPNKRLTFQFSGLGHSPLTPATLFGTPRIVSGAAPVPSLNIALMRVEGITADGITVYGVKRDTFSDLLSLGDNEGLLPIISV